MPLDVRRVGVIGLGTMGAGIVEVFARGGLDVVAIDAAAEWVDRGRGILETSTSRAVARGRLSETDRDALVGRVTWSTSVADLAGVDLVVEAVPEILELKVELLSAADAVLDAAAVIATNTSALPVTVIAEATSRPSRVVGMHFFNPAPILRCVEIIHTPHSDEAVVSLIRDLAVRLGKNPIVIGDRPGFVANTLLFGYLGDAVRLLESGRVTRENLDAAMVAAGLPMGPLALLDLIGLDVSVHILGVLYAATGAARHATPPTLTDLVAAGHLGRKTGRGLWTYDPSGKVIDAEPAGEIDPKLADALLLPYLNDALRMVGEGYASADDVDTAMRDGCGFPSGPIAQADARGLDEVAAGLAALHGASGDPATVPAPLLLELIASGRRTVR